MAKFSSNTFWGNIYGVTLLTQSGFPGQIVLTFYTQEFSLCHSWPVSVRYGAACPGSSSSPCCCRPATTASGVTLNQPQAAADGDLWADSGSRSSGEFAYTTQTGLRYLQIDLGAAYSVD
ncbi:MAG TPA: hypothetical protein PKH77_25775, partial [Anaerolineae bacterium]|nr:hypothetical protein [Anaerolineae bacterium]